MTVVRIKPIGQFPDVRKLADNARGAFDESFNAIGQFAENKYEALWANWTHKPKAQVRRTKYTVSVDIVGPNAKIFGFVNDGVPPHIIRAKGGGRRRGKKLLTFKGGKYSAKTRPNSLQFSGSGTSSGGFVSKKVVHHPGSKPRNFNRIIRNQAEAEGRKILRANLGKRKLPL
jgi:hypothetical protein